MSPWSRLEIWENPNPFDHTKLPNSLQEPRNVTNWLPISWGPLMFLTKVLITSNTLVSSLYIIAVCFSLNSFFSIITFLITVIGGNHDLEGLDEFDTDQANLDAFLRIHGKPHPQFCRQIADKTLLVGLGSTLFRDAQYTSHEVVIDAEQMVSIGLPQENTFCCSTITLTTLLLLYIYNTSNGLRIH